MENNNIEEALFQLLNTANDMYGDAVEKIWFYDGDLCPCCNKRKIDALVMGEESALSVNGFMYHDLSTLIGYFLCSYCVTNLFAKGDKQKDLYQNLEENLKKSYHEHLKSEAS